MFQIRFVEKIKTHFMFNNIFSLNSCVYENVEKYCRLGRPEITWRMRIACCITKATNTHIGRGEFRPRQTRQLPRAVDLKGLLLSFQSY